MKPDIGGVLGYNSMYVDVDVTTKVVFEPSSDYFHNELLKDSVTYERLILIHGLEPPLYNDIYNLVIANNKLFTTIYSSDVNILQHCPNSKLFLFGSCWVLTDSCGNKVEISKDYYDYYKSTDKKFKLSFINSGKTELPGHQFRNLISSKLDKANLKMDTIIPINRIETKIPLFVDSMFHITVENSQIENYFTEKIIDCFMSRTIPIYWGCPNLELFFNMSGVILFDSVTNLDNILQSLTVDDYHEREDVIEENYSLAKNYAFFYDRINSILKYEY